METDKNSITIYINTVFKWRAMYTLFTQKQQRNLFLLTQLLWMVPFCRLVPESTRWLAVRGRRDEAEKILRHAAKINNRKCPDQILVLEDKDTSVGRVSLLALRSSPLLMVRCIVICLNW